MAARRDIRRANLESLFKDYVSDGNGTRRMLKDFADLLGINAVHLSQLKNGSRGIGTRISQRIEEKLHKPPGWMDREHRASDPQTPQERAVMETIIELYRKDPAGSENALAKFYAAHGLRFPVSKRAKRSRGGASQ